MIKIELVKFEAQDVITASVCAHENVKVERKGAFWVKYCDDCNTQLDHGTMPVHPFDPDRPW